MTYSWVSITMDRYWVGSLPDPNVEAWPFFNRIMRYGSTKGPTDRVFENAVHTIPNLGQVVSCVVQDFREAVGASFYDAGKDDPTLVPSSCVVHVDAVVIHEIFKRHRFVDFTDGNAYVYMANAYNAAWKRATIYRREQAAYLKRWLVGDLFPDQEVPATSDGVPFYTLSDPIERSL